MTSPRRRNWLIGAGAAAAATGLGVAVWSHRRGAGKAAHPVFGQRFPTPDGGELVMAGLLGRPVLLNFWATWCPPCVREMPLLDAFARRPSNRSWIVVGLAVDGAAPVREFLRRQPVGFAIGLAGVDGIGLARALGNAAGGLPFSVVFDRRGRVHGQHLGELDAAALQQWRSEIQ